jgi:hypothetical protein
MGNDLRTMTAATRNILTNAEVIAVDQDSLGFQGRRVVDNGDLEVYAKRMRDSSRVVLLFNRGTGSATISFTWANAWLPSNRTCTARNLWTHQDIGPLSSSYSASVPSHDVVMVRLSPVVSSSARPMHRSPAKERIAECAAIYSLRGQRAGRLESESAGTGGRTRLVGPGVFFVIPMKTADGTIAVVLR